jgi:hypothetical protein
MERIVLHSGLSGFVLIDSVTVADCTTIVGHKKYVHAPLYLGIESLAQLGAYHVRFLADFEKHAFLLGVKRCSMPSGKELNGCFQLHGNLLGKGSSAYSYGLRATGGNGTEIEGEFLFAVVDYDETTFNRSILREHYRKVFSCLRNC